MNIKSLLLGSAAALVAVSGARAADAVVYEPEPVEYVKVCDAYGAGFFYIPGTETCLSISGYVFVQIGASNEFGRTPDYYGGTVVDGSYSPYVRARVNFDARSDTEWGTLRSYVRVQTDWVDRSNTSDGPAFFDQAFIELGGWRMGYTESAYWANKAPGVQNVNGGTYYSTNWTGYQQRFQINYTFAANGFSATIGLEDDDATTDAFGLAGPVGVTYDNFVPDVVGVVAYNAGWGGVWAKVAYDEMMANGTAIPVLLPQSLNGSVAAQIGAQLNIPNMAGSYIRLAGHYASGDNAYGIAPFRSVVLFPATIFNPAVTVGAAKWSIHASARAAFSPEVAAVGNLYYNIDHYFAGTKINTGLDSWAAEAVLLWTPVKNFEVQAGLAYTKLQTFRGTTGGYLRFTRFF